MIPRDFIGVTVDTCLQCAGIFFDEGEVNEIRARGGNVAFQELDELIQPTPEYFALEENKYRKCPSCVATMRRYRYMYSSPVFLDSCESCGGIWVENGELTKMKEYLEGQKLSKTAPLSPERDEAVATLDAIAIEQHAKADRAHRIARFLSFHPWS